MSQDSEKTNVEFSDYLSILLKWKKIIFINVIIVSIIVVILTLIIPNTYKSTATLIIPPESSMGLGSLGGLISGGNSALSLGAKLFGVSTTNEDLVLGLLNSRTVLKKVIDNYNMFEYYGIKNKNYDKAFKAIKGDLIFEPNEFGMIEVSVIHEEPDTAALIANYLVNLADSLHISINIEKASRNKNFIEKRYIQNKQDIKNAEEDFKEFQKKNKVIAVPEQIQYAVAALGELEAQLVEKEIQRQILSESISKSSSLYRMIEVQINSIKNKIQEYNSNTTAQNGNSMILPLEEIPDLQIEYLRLYREMEIQNKILEFIYPLYEQAKLEEQKSMSTLLVIDEAVPADLKYGPKRSFIVFAVVSLFILLHLPFIFRMEKIKYIKYNNLNRFEKIEMKIINRVGQLYRLKL